MNTITQSNDAELLARYAREGSEAAFAEIVRIHERLVVGAAWRRLGDIERARDAAQQVFATLARKAAALCTHRNLAGWLYQAASFEAAQLARTDARRMEREQTAAELAGTSEDHEHWSALEDGLAALGAMEREALVLHYLEDQSYAEMAATLGLGESAIRKRVSRGLENLGTQLRKRGVGVGASALLTTGAALQATLPAQAGLSAAALSMSAAPVSSALAVLMSHTTAKIAVTTAMLSLVPLAREWHTNASLHAGITARHAEIASRIPAEISRGPARDADTLRKDFAQAQARLITVRDARIATENEVAELKAQKQRIEGEVMVSMGTIEQQARGYAEVFRKGNELQKLTGKLKGQPPPDEAARKKIKDAAEDAASHMVVLAQLPGELVRLERSAAKHGRFWSTLLSEAGVIEGDKSGEVEALLTEFTYRAQGEGLALPQFDAANADAWIERRLRLGTKLMETLSPFVKSEEVATLGDLFTDADSIQMAVSMAGLMPPKKP